ncbi:hypothetical protein [Pseudaeromonas paramecii]|uniref:Type 1 fimbrial protein n=1 Tax=Pseudaeromonas paramecii TaxID=2138166 RepID=A0ABP8QGQ7_9GAMM
MKLLWLLLALCLLPLQADTGHLHLVGQLRQTTCQISLDQTRSSQPAQLHFAHCLAAHRPLSRLWLAPDTHQVHRGLLLLTYH